jgi:hypothetical protein
MKTQDLNLAHYKITAQILFTLYQNMIYDVILKKNINKKEYL